MRHQITFVGGQLLPVYVGIKEFSPDHIHFIVSDESKDKLFLLKSFLSDKIFTENICDPFDFNSIKTTCENLIKTFKSTDTVQFNLTGGTKIMVLAAQSLIQEKLYEGFYINHDNSILKLPGFALHELTIEITIKEFLELSGHSIKSTKSINDFTEEDFIATKAIEEFADNGKEFSTVIKYFRQNFNDKKLSLPKSGNLRIDETLDCKWDKRKIEVFKERVNIFTATSDNIRTLFFYSVWWELTIAKQILQWTKPRELLIQCELPFKGDIKTPKSEIDILINLGRKLIFVECKSGLVKQEDINKMKIIRDTYGGVISKSILVSRYNPAQNIIEKCNELNIEVFYLYEDEILIHPLYELLDTLDKFEKRLAL